MARVDRQAVQSWVLQKLQANGGSMTYAALVEAGSQEGFPSVASEIRPLKEAGLIRRSVKVVEGGSPSFTIHLQEGR